MLQGIPGFLVLWTEEEHDSLHSCLRQGIILSYKLKNQMWFVWGAVLLCHWTEVLQFLGPRNKVGSLARCLSMRTNEQCVLQKQNLLHFLLLPFFLDMTAVICTKCLSGNCSLQTACCCGMEWMHAAWLCWQLVPSAGEWAEKEGALAAGSTNVLCLELVGNERPN